MRTHMPPTAVTKRDWGQELVLGFQRPVSYAQNHLRMNKHCFKSHTKSSPIKEQILNRQTTNNKSWLTVLDTSQSKANTIRSKQSITRIPMFTGSRDSLLVRAPDSGSKRCEFESRQERRENFLLQSLTLVRCPFHPRVTAVARKRPRPFCQKCRWQVTPKHAYTLDPTKSEWADSAAAQA